MKYKLINPVNKNYSVIEQILTNRGIPIEDIPHYLNTTDDDINQPELFGEDKMRAAANILMSAIKEEKNAIVIVDSDCDGYGSASLLINYLYDIAPTWVENHLKYKLHNGKQHGLADHIQDLIKDSSELILIPDAGSNDVEECKILHDQEKQIIILDHHICEVENPYAIVINTENSDYPNKALCGCGVTWQFCRYIDKNYNYSFADKYVDLVALTLISDMMDLRSIETKHLIQKGLKNIHNPFIVYMAEKNSYSLGGKLTPIGVAFYIVPFVNCVMRSGTQEEKELLLNSMIVHNAFKEAPSTKRGHKSGDTEKIVEQAVRVSTNVKARQTKTQNAVVEVLKENIKKKHLLDHKVLLFLLDPGEVDRNVAGLCANKIMSEYQRPVCVLTKTQDENSKIIYQGSMRGCTKAGIDNFKEVCDQTGAVEYVSGHQNASGLGIDEDKIESFIEKTDKLLANISSEPIYHVDYVYNNNEINGDSILEIAKLDDLWGQEIDEPIIAIESLKVSSDMVTVYTKKNITIKITLPNKISLMLFNAKDKDVERLQTNNTGFVELSIVGKCNANTWNGITTPQIFIEDYDIIDSNEYYF